MSSDDHAKIGTDKARIVNGSISLKRVISGRGCL